MILLSLIQDIWSNLQIHNGTKQKTFHESCNCITSNDEVYWV